MLQNKGQVDLQDVIRCKNRSTFTNFVFQILMSRICNRVFLLFVQIWKLNINLQGRILCFIKKKKSSLFIMFICFIQM